jgi:ABC-type branched-subunit amino acid transport system substrate-binding protein
MAKKDLRKVEHCFTRTMFNPNTEVKMILAQEQAILKGQIQFEQIATFVRQASADGQPIHEVELVYGSSCYVWGTRCWKDSSPAQAAVIWGRR